MREFKRWQKKRAETDQTQAKIRFTDAKKLAQALNNIIKSPMRMECF